MPEGPEVRITADGLNAQLKGFNIYNVKITEASRYYKNNQINLPNYDKLEYPLLVKSVYPKGKKIILECKDVKNNPIVLISALAMEGSWKLHSGKHAGIELICKNSNQSKTLYFHDTRHFGSFHICLSQDDIDFVLKAVGPDLLNENISFEQYDSVISNEKLGNKEICWFMMEQKFFSGIGNYILAEVLYASKILPTRLLKNLSSENKYDLWYHSKRILNEAYTYGGLTIATYFSMAGERGIFRTKVYGQKYDPFGNPVLTGTFTNSRTSHYVPAVQT